MTAAVIKALTYFGVIFLLGAGVYRFVIAHALRAAAAQRRGLTWGAGTGAAVLIAASLLGIVWRLTQVLGRFDLPLSLEYLLTTGGGRLALLRVGLVLLTLLSLRLRSAWPFFLLALGVLYSFSATSHAAVLHGNFALITDLGHFVGAGLWGGAVLYTSLFWESLGTERLVALGRVSRVGLGSVILLTATGVYTSTLHLAAPAELVSTPYGLVLSIKLALVAVILGVAALNRWHFLPRLRAEPQTHIRFGRILLLEALLLLTVFAATGLLTTSPLPHN